MDGLGRRHLVLEPACFDEAREPKIAINAPASSHHPGDTLPVPVPTRFDRDPPRLLADRIRDRRQQLRSEARGHQRRPILEACVEFHPQPDSSGMGRRRGVNEQGESPGQLPGRRQSQHFPAHEHTHRRRGCRQGRVGRPCLTIDAVRAESEPDQPADRRRESTANPVGRRRVLHTSWEIDITLGRARRAPPGRKGLASTGQGQVMTAGRTTVKRDPLPRAESTQMRPWWLSTIDLTIDKPRPVPETSSGTFEARKNLSNR